MKPQRPASFNGKKKRLQNFFSQLDIYAQLAGQHWTKKDRVLQATMLLTGAAANWVQPYLHAAKGNQEFPMLTNYTLLLRAHSARLCWVAIGWHGVGCRLWNTGQGLEMDCV